MSVVSPSTELKSIQNVKNENDFDREEDLDLEEDNTRTMAITGISSAVLLEDRAHFLMVIEGPDEGCRIELSEAPLLIGRHHSVDLPLDDTEIAGKHCTIQATMGYPSALPGNLLRNSRLTQDKPRLVDSAWK